MLYSLKVATLGHILAHITKLLLVSFRCFFNILAFSVNICMKKLSGNFSSTTYAIFYIGLDFLLKYLLYFLRLFSPLLSKSVAA